MALVIPETPAPRPWAPFIIPPPVKGIAPKFEWGEAVNAPPLEGEMFISFTTPSGKVSGVFYSLVFQLRKWGYIRYKIDEAFFVSPVFKQYYDLTVAQKDQLQATIKAGLASISQAIADYELVKHDLRKYKEFLDYFTKIEKGKREKNKNLIGEGETTLKSFFIDLVDVHTGEGIALKLIAPRWPTIIVDFMNLEDVDIVHKDIAKKYKITEAEGGVLATKNKLYQEWRDKMFKPVVLERYKTLLGLSKAREQSIKEYRQMLKPTIARFKMMKDALESPGDRGDILTAAGLKPGANAVSMDATHMWAWRPFAPSEKYKITRESFDLIDPLKAGFNGREVRELQDAGLISKKNPTIFGLPQEPSIDRIVRFYYKEADNGIGAVEKEYGVKLNAIDLFKARQMLVDQFRFSFSALSAIEPWIWSPYFVFIDIPWKRVVFRLPNGAEMEDLEIEPLLTATYSQNLILVRCLELVAKEKQMENYINSMLAEYGTVGSSVESLTSVEDIAKQEFPEVYMSEEDIKKQKTREETLKSLESVEDPRIKFTREFTKIRMSVGKIFENIGFDIQFFRAIGPYEFAMQNRMAKVVQREPGSWFGIIKDFLKTKFEVPGTAVQW